MIEVLIILALIILNGLFAMSEIALISARRARLESQAAKGDEKAREALDLQSHPDKFISTVQLAITLITLLNGVFSGKNIEDNIVAFLNQYEWLRPYSSNIATVLVIIIVTYFSLVLGELVPKRIGLSNPEGISKNIVRPMRFISRATQPFLWLLGKSSDFIIKLFKIKPNETLVTEEEIKAIISEGTEHGTIEEAEQQIIERVFRLGDRNITSLMTHRSDMVWLDANLTVADVKNSHYDIHSVYPLCEGSIDQIKGVIYLKDLFVSAPDTLLKTIVHPSTYVPENNSAYNVLEKFQSSKIHYAFIVDEYGTLQGMITLNDILEAIVGDIAQPHEEDYEIVTREDGSFLVDAQLPYFNFLSHFYKTSWLEVDEDGENFNTLAGFILYHLERIPVTGDKLDYRGLTFEIIDMDGQRIDKVLITLSPEEMEKYMEMVNEE